MVAKNYTSGGMSVPGSGSLGTEATNWNQQAATTTDECSSITDPAAKKQCRRDKRARESGTMTSQYKAGSGSLGTTPVQAPGTAASVRPAGGYDAQIGQSALNAPAGTFAAGLGTYGLGTAGENPAAFTQNYMATNYGLAPNSMGTNLANQYYSPTPERMMGILGELPGTNIDAVNFGAALMDHFSGTLGAQLDPKRMTATIVEGAQAAAGTELSPEDVGPGGFASIVNNPDPLAGIDSLISMLKGALAGTMPANSLESWLNSLQVYATQLITGQGGMMNQTMDQIASEEGSGNSWFDKLVNTLGPTLGL